MKICVAKTVLKNNNYLKNYTLMFISINHDNLQ